MTETTTLTITEDPASTLSYSGDLADYETDLRDHQIKWYGEQYLAAGERLLADRPAWLRAYDVAVVITGDASRQDEARRRNLDALATVGLDEDAAHDLLTTIWQDIHDRVGMADYPTALAS